MPAFIVKDSIINSVLTLLATDVKFTHARHLIRRETGTDITLMEERERLGKAMRDLNCAAVKERNYNRIDEPAPYAYRDELVKPIQAFKRLTCWMCQCSEGNISGSPLYQAIQKVRASMAEIIVFALPEYDRAD